MDVFLGVVGIFLLFGRNCRSPEMWTKAALKAVVSIRQCAGLLRPSEALSGKPVNGLRCGAICAAATGNGGTEEARRIAFKSMSIGPPAGIAEGV